MQREGICCTFPLQFHELLNKLLRKVINCKFFWFCFLKSISIKVNVCLSVSPLCIPKSFFIRLQSNFGELLSAQSGRFLKDRMGILYCISIRFCKGDWWGGGGSEARLSCSVEGDEWKTSIWRMYFTNGNKDHHHKFPHDVISPMSLFGLGGGNEVADLVGAVLFYF